MKWASVLLSSALLVTIPTAHFDNSRQNWNSSETVLTPSSILSPQFQKLTTCSVDGGLDSQPLYVPSVSGHNLVIVATMNNTLYAFDADSNPCAQVWSTHFEGPRTAYPFQSSNTFLYGAPVGCLAAPVIDTVNNWIFTACTNATPSWVLRKSNLATGTTISSVTITGQVPGTGTTGDRVVGGQLQFYPDFSLLRSALTLANGNVYLFFGSYADASPWHGWAFAYDEASLTQQAIFCTTPNGSGGAFWGSNGGAAVDQSGNLYEITGNGDFDGSSNFSNTFTKYSAALSLSDWFTPSNYAAITAGDWDLSSNRVLLWPGTSLLVGGGKDFRVWVLDTTNMGHLQGAGGKAPNQILTTVPGGTPTDNSGSYGMLGMNNTLYMPIVNGPIYSFAYSGGIFSASATVGGTNYSTPGAANIAGSSNGASNGILWTVTSAGNAYQTPQNGTLRALNPSTMAEYWNSGVIGTMSKFASPLVANGRVFVSTLSNNIAVFGLTPPVGGSSVSGQVTVSGGVTIH